MNGLPRSILVLGPLAVLTTALHGGAQQLPAQRADGTVKSGVSAVLVDVVVRNKHGMPVRDLQPSDVEIVEDGATQAIDSFTPIFAAEVAPTPTLAPGPLAASRSTIAADANAATLSAAKLTPITALVFDRLSPEGRQLAVKAARAYVSERNPLPSMMGV